MHPLVDQDRRRPPRAYSLKEGPIGGATRKIRAGDEKREPYRNNQKLGKLIVEPMLAKHVAEHESNLAQSQPPGAKMGSRELNLSEEYENLGKFFIGAKNV